MSSSRTWTLLTFTRASHLRDILQFDRINPSTQRMPLDFTDFNAVDAIQDWGVIRLGVNNRFQTRRDNQTINWLEINSYFDINIQRPKFEDAFLSLPQSNSNTSAKTPIRGVVADPGTFSNVYNRLTWQPYSWVRMNVDSQLPLLDTGFTEINSNLNFFLNQDTSIQLGHQYIQGNPLFTDSSFLIVGAYRRITDNWAVSFREAYEFNPGYLAQQRYAIHRDLRVGSRRSPSRLQTMAVARRPWASRSPSRSRICRR